MSMIIEFEPGVAIVAGGTGGLGSQICRQFAKANVPVYFTYHGNQARAEALATELVDLGGQCDFQKVNLADPGQVADLFSQAQEKYQSIRHVVYAAGPHFEFNFIGQIPNEEWHSVVDQDINGAFHVIQSAVKAFRQNHDGGNLVALITCAVEKVPVADIMSAAPKAAIEMLIRGVAKEAGRFNIRANCVGPGFIYSGLGKQALDEKLDEKTREYLRKTAVPMQRFGEADDIASAVLFLCSKRAKYITGQSIAVDGGMQL